MPPNDRSSAVASTPHATPGDRGPQQGSIEHSRRVAPARYTMGVYKLGIFGDIGVYWGIYGVLYETGATERKGATNFMGYC